MPYDTIEKDFPLRKRLTHKYVSSYDYLDSWEGLGKIAILNYAEVRTDDEDPCDCKRHFYEVKIELDKPLSDSDVAEAIEHTLSYGGCACEHDCCGCRSLYVDNAERARRFNFGHRDEPYQIWLVTASSSRNY